jgi:hypothetical protein
VVAFLLKKKKFLSSRNDCARRVVDFSQWRRHGVPIDKNLVFPFQRESHNNSLCVYVDIMSLPPADHHELDFGFKTGFGSIENVHYDPDFWHTGFSFFQAFSFFKRCYF